MTKRVTKKQKNCITPVKSSSKKQNKSLPKKTPRLILPKKLELELINYNYWTVEQQRELLNYYNYNIITKTKDSFSWEEFKRDSSVNSSYIQHTEENVLCEDLFIIKNNNIYYYSRNKEFKIFSNLLKDILKLSNSPFLTYYINEDDFYWDDLGLIPKTEAELFKTTIEIYNKNYDDRITTLKAAFEQKQLEQVQSSSDTNKVSRAPKRKKSVCVQNAARNKLATA